MKQTYTIKLEPSTIEALKKRAKILGHNHTAYSRHVLETAVTECEHEYIPVPINGIIHNQSAMCHKCGFVPTIKG